MIQNYFPLDAYLRSRRFQLECAIDRYNKSVKRGCTEHLAAESELTEIISVQSYLDDLRKSPQSTREKGD